MSLSSSEPSSNGWLTKDSAAARLGISVRTLERHIDEKRLSTRLQPEPGRRPRVLVDPHSLDSLAAELSAVRGGGQLAAPAAAAPPAPVGAAELVDQLGPALASFADRLAAELASAVRPSPAAAAPVRPWLTLDEAVEYSGLPKGWLLAQARGGCPVALNVSMGRGESWRFSRRRLAALGRA
jgi:hypothetical protein